MKSWLATILCFAFPVLTDFLPRRTKRITVHVRKHTRRGFAVKRHTRQMTVPDDKQGSSVDPYAYLGNMGPPVFQQTTEVVEDNEYYTVTRTTDKLVLLPGAKITHAPRFETEYVVDGSRARVKTNGDIVVTEIRYKKKGAA